MISAESMHWRPMTEVPLVIARDGETVTVPLLFCLRSVHSEPSNQKPFFLFGHFSRTGRGLDWRFHVQHPPNTALLSWAMLAVPPASLQSHWGPVGVV